MDFELDDEAVQFRQQVRSFVQAELSSQQAHLVPGEDPYSEFNLVFCRKLADKGWLVPHWPRQYGGSDASPWMFAVLSEELWMAGEPRGSQYMNVNWVGPAIIGAGTEAQKAYHLHGIARGEALWCQGFSEQGAGSDLAAMVTSAIPNGDDYVIDGEKVWTSYARKAEFCFLLAQVPDKGVTIFLVPMTLPGIKVEVLPSILGVHEIHRMTFRKVSVPASCRLGAEGEGWNIVRNALSDERVLTPRYARAARMLEHLIGIAQEQGRFAEPALRRQATLARAACESARLLSYRVRQARGKEEYAGPDAYLGRVAIVRAERAVAELSLDILGEATLEAGSLGDGQFRTAMIAGLGGGSYEMQLNLISRLCLALPK